MNVDMIYFFSDTPAVSPAFVKKCKFFLIGKFLTPAFLISRKLIKISNPSSNFTQQQSIS